jgi:cell wall-associated NlpC family hydrolase
MRNCIILLLLCVACRQSPEPLRVGRTDSTIFDEFRDTARFDTTRISALPQKDTALPAKIVAFAKTQLGVPYRYCSMDPKGGFDCSGFVNYVFTHFNITVPRSSIDFTNEGREIPLNGARPGDLILFTGTDVRRRVVGHIGIITSNNNGDISFIQATSGDAYAVVISPLNKNYMNRFIKVIRIVE